jgi:uncharacterized protein YqcC (DUF446 family)
MNKIVEISIPVPDYFGVEVFFQSLYFKESPSKKYVLEVLEQLHKEG